jgi:uncharacterized protein with von Willebrand factor type A (vWA) domain
MQKERTRVDNNNRNFLISKHSESVVDQMDMGTLRAIVRDSIESNLWKMTNKELQKVLSEYNPQVLETNNDSNPNN